MKSVHTSYIQKYLLYMVKNIVATLFYKIYGEKLYDEKNDKKIS